MKLFVSLFLSIGMLNDSSGMTFISQEDGCWNDKSVWQNGIIPGYNISDTVIINTHVSFLQDITLLNSSVLQINPSGSICGHFDIHVLTNAEFLIYGSFYADTILVPEGHIEINNSRQAAYFFIITVTFPGSIHIQGAFVSAGPPFTCNCGEVGLSEISNNYSGKFFVFPIPSDGDIFIRAEMNITRIEVWNSAGQMEKTFPSVEKVSLPGKPGIYFLRVYLNNEVMLTKEVLRIQSNEK